MRTASGWLLTALTVVAAGCGSSPTAPAATLALSQSQLSLARTATASVTATSTLNGAATDVTAAAAWQSSNAAVATVTGGVITATGPGNATITASHGASSQTLTVTVRRRTSLSGTVTIEAVDDSRNINAATLWLNGREVGGSGTSNTQSVLNVHFVQQPVTTAVDPGSHDILVTISSIGTIFRPARPSYSYRLTWTSPATLIDLDTGETVSPLNLDTRTVEVGGTGSVTWTVAVAPFTS